MGFCILTSIVCGLCMLSSIVIPTSVTARYFKQYCHTRKCDNIGGGTHVSMV